MWVVGAGVLIVLIAAVVTLVSSFGSTITLQLGDAVLKVQTITTEPERQKGLRDKAVARQGGLLFVFENEEMWPLATENLRAPVDIIWLDANKKVVEVVAGVESDTPNNAVVAKKRAKYAVVLEEGAAVRFAIRPGKVASFELTK